MTKDEALRLALEAMEYADACLKKQLTTKEKHEHAQDLLMEAGTAIKAALEAKDEPDYKALWQQMCERCDELDKKLAQPEHGWTPERIAGMARLKAQQDKRLEPQRTWVGLTDEEIWACLPKDPDEMAFARAIETKLKEKNK
jgi:hypothetical protein